MADKASRPTFILYKSMWESISDLDDKYLGQLFRAIFEYQISGIEPETHSIIYRDFRHFKPHFDRDDVKYQGIVDKKRLAGAEGGKQKAANLADASTSYNSKQTLANVAHNGNVNDNDILSTPLPPSSPEVEEVKKKKRPSKTREETTKDAAVAYYKTECEAASTVAPGAEAENYRLLALEICGKKSVECPNGMVNTLMRLPEQLSFDQYRKLCEKMGGHVPVRDMLIEMHTSFDEHVKSKNTIYGVCNNWYNRRVKAEAKHGGNGSNGQPAPMVARAIKHGPHGD